MRIIIAFAILWAPQVSAKSSLSRYQVEQILKDIPADYTNLGAVTEEIARIETYRRFPIESYEIRRGIDYYDAAGHKLGELDIVVFDRETGRVVYIAEVKTSRGARELRRAIEQRDRFRAALDNGTVTALVLNQDESVTFNLKRFRGEWKSELIGIRGAQSPHLLDQVLDFTRDEIATLRTNLLATQRRAWKEYKRKNGSIKLPDFVNKIRGPLHEFDFEALLMSLSCKNVFS